MSEKEWKQEAQRMTESYRELYDENQRLRSELNYAHSVLDDAIQQFNEGNKEPAAFRQRLQMWDSFRNDRRRR